MNEVEEMEEGQIVWAKLKGYDWWPGMIVPASLCKPMMGHDNEVQLCLYWYGHNTISKLERSLKICDFLKGFAKYNLNNRTKLFKYGVMQAAKDLMMMQKQTLHGHFSHQEVLAWLLSDDFRCMTVTQGKWKLSAFVQQQLELLTARFIGQSNSHTSPNSANKNTNENSKQKWFKSPGLCLSCGSSETELFVDHPIFDQRVCSLCLENFKCDYFVLKDNDILGHPFSELSHGGSICFMCDTKSGGVPIRNDWRANVYEMLHPMEFLQCQIVASTTSTSILCYKASLSTAEALSSCIKEAMGIEHLKLFFYAATPQPGHDDKHLLEVQDIQKALNCSITHINDMSKFQSLGKNYIIGSIPGDKDVGPYFFNFYQIINSRKDCKWLFQMQAPFCKKYITIISRFLECPPGLWQHNKLFINCTWTSELSILKILEEPKYNEFF